MPGWERVGTAWKSIRTIHEYVGNNIWKPILAGYEWTGTAWKLIYAALSACRNLRVTSRTTTTTTTSSDGSWGPWRYYSNQSATAQFPITTSALPDIPRSTSTEQYRRVNVHTTVDGATHTITADIERRVYGTSTSTTTRRVTTYAAHWDAPLYGAFTRYRIDRSSGSDILINNISNRTYTLGTSRGRIRIRAEHTVLGIVGPWTGWVSY